MTIWATNNNRTKAESTKAVWARRRDGPIFQRLTVWTCRARDRPEPPDTDRDEVPRDAFVRDEVERDELARDELARDDVERERAERERDERSVTAVLREST